jgi:hypothetical protein
LQYNAIQLKLFVFKSNKKEIPRHGDAPQVHQNYHQARQNFLVEGKPKCQILAFLFKEKLLGKSYLREMVMRLSSNSGLLGTIQRLASQGVKRYFFDTLNIMYNYM